MRRPSVANLPAALRDAALLVSKRLGRRGARAWVVGGTVRDLALGLEAADLDMASPARPEVVEELFESVHAVGRAFGTMLVRAGDVEVQLTTFRRERGYADARHPDVVLYADDPESDAARRDFTLNAMYLDPGSDELLDPFAGLADLERGLLRCVGRAEERFAEDGLRLLRMARFAAAYGLEVDADTMRAARDALAALRGVSPERILGELEAIARRKGRARALSILAECGAAAILFPALASARGGPGTEERLSALERREGLEPAPDLSDLLAIWLDSGAPGEGASSQAGLASLEWLRPSKVLARAVTERWRALGILAEASRTPEARGPRAELVRLAAGEDWPALSALALAWVGLREPSRARIEELRRWAQACAREWRKAGPGLRSEDVASAGVAPGPRFGALLREAEERQLLGELGSREEALAWLRDRAGSPD